MSAAATWLAWLRTYGTGPSPPKRPNPRPPAPIRIMSRRETPLSDNFLLAIALCLSDEPQLIPPGGKRGHYRREWSICYLSLNLEVGVRKAVAALALSLLVVVFTGAESPYYPPAGAWAHKTPAEVGMDAARLGDAIEFMKSHETRSPARDFSDQEIVNGKLLASMPTERAATNAPDHPSRLHSRRVRRHAASRPDL